MRRVPRAAWWVAFIAFLNAAVWSFVTPPFHVPDETAHVQYLQYLAETGKVPNEAGAEVFSPDQSAVLDALLFNQVVGREDDLAIWSELHDDGVDAAEDRSLPRDGQGGIVESSSQPPLFYALEAGVYLASPSTGLLDRLALMRLFAALLAGVTTLFVFLFLREVLEPPWTWTVGALAVAFQPLFGFISGGVTPDVLLFAASAALFFTLARAFRRGLTPALGLAIGAALAVGVLAKLNFVALLPGAFVGLGLLASRGRDGERGPAVRGALAACGVLAVVAAAYIALNVGVWDRSAWGRGVETAAINVTGGAEGTAPIGPAEQLSYTWQLYLPRLPFMNDQFANFPPYTTWLKGTVGIFGWVDTTFPEWVYRIGAGVAIVLAVLLLVALWERRAVLWARRLELLTYAVIVIGLLASVGFLGIRYRRDSGFTFEQARYLLPFLPLYGAAVALAAQALGRRLARPLAAALVVLAIGHSLVAQLLVIGRFYG